MRKTSSKNASRAAPRAKLEKLITHLSGRNWTPARALSIELLKKHPNDVNALMLGARVALDAERNAELSLKRAEAALRLAPEAAEAHRGALLALSALGDREGVAGAAERWIAADPARAGGYYELARVDARRAARHLPMMRSLMAMSGGDRASQAMLANAIGLIEEKEGRHHEAFCAFLSSKAALGRAYDPAPFQRFFEACETLFTEERLAASPEREAEGRSRVFVLGLPRTGSTLIEQILSAHPKVDAIGEARALDAVLSANGAGVGGDGSPLPRLAAFLDRGDKAFQEVAGAYRKAVALLTSDPSAARIVDKMPGNFLYGGLIAVLFPHARLIMTDRDPRDAMLSCLRTFFTTGQSFTAGFDTFLAHWRLHQAFAELWRGRLGARCADARYETVIANPEGEARRLIAHIGLDWDPRCARPEATKGVVQTASALQVRQKIHSRSIGGWRRYEAEFEPFNKALAELGWSESAQV